MGTERFVENELASNGFVAVLRLGLADELDRLQRDLARSPAARGGAGEVRDRPDDSLGDVAAQLAVAVAAGQR